MFCSRVSLCRFFLLICVFVVSCLFVYQIDITPTFTYARDVLTDWSRVEEISSTIATTKTTATTTSASTTVTTTTTTSVSTSKLNPNQTNNISDQPKEAFVTFSNNQPTYLALLKVFLDSVHAFSTRPVIAFGIDVDLDIDVKEYPRLIKRKIKQSDCGPSVYFCKLHAIVSSNVDYGVLMETDDVVNYNVDVLFDVLRVWPFDYPLSPRHPDDPQNYGHFLQQHNVSRRTTPYIHAHVIWNFRAIPFLKNLQSLLRSGHFQGANFDETGVNVMLWAAKANHTLCKYDPYFTYSDAYEKWPVVVNCTRYCHTVFITLHGSKEVKESKALLERLKANAGKPALQTLGMGGFKEINDTSVTCCYPDSRPSRIHPLLCEHDPSR